MSNEMPGDPFLPPGIAGAMQGMYEMYAGAVQAGFTESQAMQFVIAVMLGMMKSNG